MRTIAILSALDKEMSLIRSTYPAQVQKIEGCLHIEEHIDSERDFQLISVVAGMGLTAAGSSAQALISLYHPDILIFSGIAGNLNSGLGFADIVIGQRLVYPDADTGIIAECDPYLSEFSSDPQLIHLITQKLESMGFERKDSNQSICTFMDAASLMYGEENTDGFDSAGIRTPAPNRRIYPVPARFVVGTIASSDIFSTDQPTLMHLINHDFADAEEMEGTAVAHVCARNRVPVLVIRSISNDCGESYDELDNRTEDLIIAANSAARVAIAAIEEWLEFTSHSVQ